MRLVSTGVKMEFPADGYHKAQKAIIEKIFRTKSLEIEKGSERFFAALGLFSHGYLKIDKETDTTFTWGINEKAESVLTWLVKHSAIKAC